MAFCPKCNHAMLATDVECPNCGYDFPSPDQPLDSGWEYSNTADIVLLVCALLAGIGAAIALLGVPAYASQERWLEAFVYSPIAFGIALGNMIVFIRVARLKR